MWNGGSWPLIYSSFQTASHVGHMFRAKRINTLFVILSRLQVYILVEPLTCARSSPEVPSNIFGEFFVCEVRELCLNWTTSVIIFNKHKIT